MTAPVQAIPASFSSSGPPPMALACAPMRLAVRATCRPPGQPASAQPDCRRKTPEPSSLLLTTVGAGLVGAAVIRREQNARLR
ncbi:MAG: PEP-CTERM sorting domain-containing protein [Deltaproteobacteria bacterium]|nr:PEP-CTERM sorting domain-containing protein [Deltaproteobacteria bacterium]